MDMMPATPADYRSYFQSSASQFDDAAELENDAKLAIHLTAFLRFAHDRTSGAWTDRDQRTTMRNTCHALEALHLLDLPAYTSETLNEGATWLINLSSDESGRLGVDEFSGSRWHPSRFKTLAWLGRFEAREVQSDFNALSNNVDGDGFLHNVHPRHRLATLIYLDTLYYLNQPDDSFPLPEAWKQAQSRALGAIHNQVQIWASDPTRMESLFSLQELSYALDILLTYKLLPPSDPVLQTIRERLMSALNTPDESRLLRAEAFYFCIQLSRHYQAEPRTKQLLKHVSRALLQAYQIGDGAISAQDFSFHPLVLRLLITYHGQELRDAILRQLFDSYEERSREKRQKRETEIKNEIRELLHRQVDITIHEVSPLSGGMRSEKVYSVEFDVSITAPNGQDTAPPFRSEKQRIVVKTARFSDLRKSIDEYRQLPPISAASSPPMPTSPSPRGKQGDCGLFDHAGLAGNADPGDMAESVGCTHANPVAGPDPGEGSGTTLRHAAGRTS